MHSSQNTIESRCDREILKETALKSNPNDSMSFPAVIQQNWSKKAFYASPKRLVTSFQFTTFQNAVM